jgi:hypothetical protein
MLPFVGDYWLGAKTACGADIIRWRTEKTTR